MSSSYGDPETRFKILESARELAETMGPGMRVSDIAEHAGVSRQAIYLHFKDRAGLVLALLEHMVQVYGVHALTETVAAAASPSERLRRLVEVLATLHGHVDRLAWLFDEGQHHDEAFGRDWRNRAQGTHAFVREHVRAIADDGALAPNWSVASATDFVYALTSLGSWQEFTRDLGWSRRRYINRVQAWLVSAVLA